MNDSISRILLWVSLFVFGCTAYDVHTTDTEANRKGFERHIKIKPTEEVSQVYYYADELGADVRYQLSFKCDKAWIEKILTKLSLKNAPADYSGLAPRVDLKWWNPESTKGKQLWINSENGYYRELWYSEEDSIAYYHEYSI